MKQVLTILLSAIICSTTSCQKQAVTPEKSISPKKELLTKTPWKLTELSWVQIENGVTKEILTLDSLPACQRDDPYKFNDWIMTVPYGTVRDCDNPPQSGKFELSEDGTKLYFSLFMYYVDSMLEYDVLELSESRFSIQTTASPANNNNHIEMVFIR